MKKYSNFIAILIAIFTLTAFTFPIENLEKSDAKNETFTEYCNLRFDYCLAYPSEYFTQQESSDNGDGAVFLSNDGKITMTIVGAHNVMKWTPKDIFYFTFEDRFRNPNLFVENLGSEITETGFEAQYIVDDEYWYYNMYLLDDSYVVLHLKSNIEDRETLDAYVPELRLELKI